jgi:hypothetical protein
MIKDKDCYVIIIFLVFVAIGLLSIFLKLTIFTCKNSSDIHIPDSNMIKNFCQKEGYDNGWLSSSSCGLNEVQCYKKVWEYLKYDCVKYE